MNDKITEAIQYAKKYADAAPIEFKEVTYQTALRHYLEGNEAEVNAEPRSNRKKPIPKIIPDKYLNDLLGSDYDWSNTGIRDLPPIGQYLKILQIAKNEFEINTLSSENIKKILSEKFRISKTINAIGMSMMESVGKYVDRTKRGNEYHYKITSNGETRLQQLQKKLGVKHA